MSLISIQETKINHVFVSSGAFSAFDKDGDGIIKLNVLEVRKLNGVLSLMLCFNVFLCGCLQCCLNYFIIFEIVRRAFDKSFSKAFSKIFCQRAATRQYF